MKITVGQLDAITSSPEALMFPARVSADSSSEPGTWWGHVDEVLRRATESDLMVVALYAKLAMETYHGLIESIDIEWTTKQDDGDAYNESRVYINKGHYHPEIHDLHGDLAEQMEDIDDMGSMRALYTSTVNAMGGRQTGSELMARAKFLFDTITSVEDVDAIIALIDPDIRAFYDEKIMQLQTEVPVAGPKSMGRM